MWDFDYSSPGSIKFVLEENGLKMTKARGQNFLIDNNVRKKIVDLIIDGLREGESVWEVGPGIGSLTSLLLKKGMTVKVFELDYGFINILESALKNENIQIVKGDALDTIKDEVKNIRISEFPKVIAGNLPYNVGTLLIASLLENQIFPDRMVFTLQKEVAQRIAAKERREGKLEGILESKLEGILEGKRQSILETLFNLVGDGLRDAFDPKMKR